MWMGVYGVCVECIGSIGNSGVLVFGAGFSAVLWFLGVLLYSLRCYGLWLRGDVQFMDREEINKKRTSKRGKSSSSPPKKHLTTKGQKTSKATISVQGHE